MQDRPCRKDKMNPLEIEGKLMGMAQAKATKEMPVNERGSGPISGQQDVFAKCREVGKETNMMRNVISDGLIVNVKMALAHFEDWDLRKQDCGLKAQSSKRVSKTIGSRGIG